MKLKEVSCVAFDGKYYAKSLLETRVMRKWTTQLKRYSEELQQVAPLGKSNLIDEYDERDFDRRC